jgi:subtilisin family serine protease
VRFALLPLLLALLVACTATPRLPTRAMLPDASKAGPEHYLVVTIRNPVGTMPLRAASTRRGYDGGGVYVAGEVARAAGGSLAADYGLVEVASWPISLLGVDCLVYGVPPSRTPEALIAALGRDRRVESVQALQSFDTQASYNDPYGPLQKNVARMSIAEAHLMSRGGGARVAVIDTGADLGHPDLRPGAARGRNFVDDDGAGFRTDTHGTAVAGVIGAVPNNGVGIVGIAPDAELLVYKACWRAEAGGGSVCNTFTLAQALSAAIEARADVINLSLGGPADPLLTRLVRRGLEGGAIVVGATPRDGVRRGFPVGIDGVIAVSADDSAQAADVVHAPGQDVLSLSPDGHYDFYSGSSLASAEVTGVLALMRASNPRLTAREAGALLQSSSRAGSVNACAALSAVRRHGACEPAAATASGHPASP